MDATSDISRGGELISFKNLIAKSWQEYKNKYWTLMAIMLAPTLSAYIIGLATASATLAVNSDGLSLSRILAATFLTLILVVLNIWAQGALILAADAGKEKLNLISLYRRAWPKVGQLWWTAILSALIIMAGLVLFIIPAIVIGISLGLVNYIVMLDKFKGLDALVVSQEYTYVRRGQFVWRIVGLIGTAIVVYIIGGTIAGLITTSDESAQQLSEVILSLLTTPFFTLYLYLLYREVKRMRGEVDLTSAKARRTRRMYKILAIASPLIWLIVSVGAMFLFSDTLSNVDSLLKLQPTATPSPVVSQ